MFARLSQPGGVLGALSVAATLIFTIVAVLGFLSMTAAWTTATGIWSDKGDRVLGSVLFVAMILGAVGFLVMDRLPLLGALLAIVGSVGLAISVFWTVVPVILGVVFSVVAVKRAQGFQERAAHA